MPFGAHETMEVHEILMEKINAITHFNLYAQHTQNPQLLDMIVRHQQEEIVSYNAIVDMTRGNTQFTPIPPNTEVRGVSNQQVQYGLKNPPQFAPQVGAALNDADIAIAVLLCHKNGARNCTWAALECADPNLRRLLLNCAATCTNQAYEVFLLMNEQGVYQVPTLKDHTAKTFLHRYQPASDYLEAQYNVQGGQPGQNETYAGQNMGYAQSGYGTMNNNLNVGSRDSVLYGADRSNPSWQYQGNNNSSAYERINGVVRPQ